MKRSMEFELAWQGMKLGEHNFEFQLGKDFFTGEHSSLEDIVDIEAKVELKFVKHETFFELHFDIGGYIITPCDRCGDEFRMELWDEFDLIVKLDDSERDEMMEEDADVVFIPRSETVLDISKWLYEFVVLSIPLQRIHPDDAEGKSTCNQEALRLLGKLAEQPEAPKNDLWEGLKSIKIKKSK
ncbi:DUF177 domain-containing protein [Rurimicrobium arvi]|uniref:DUF177 domain-containing protein n=1 Tax=Rurimicrobium arvi TaxID=2049916 RepID=A0ABP8MLJ4_9BACT